MATIDLQIKKGDTRDWVFTLNDSSGTAIDVTGTRVRFKMRTIEGDGDAFFTRDTDGTGSDYITLTTPTSGIVSITPVAANWTAVSDYGIYIGEFRISDTTGRWRYTDDVLIDIQEAII